MPLVDLLSLGGVVLIGLALLGGLGILANERLGASRRRARLGGAGKAGSVGSDAQATLMGIVRRVQRVGDYVTPQDPRELSILRAKLVHSGFMQREAVAVYLGARALAMAVAIGACAMLLPRIMNHTGGIGAIALTGAVALAAILGPDKILGKFRAKLQLEYREGFPDLLDLLVASVEAGLSLDAAVTRVADELVRRYPNLARALRILTLELRAGKSRKEAWTTFAERLGLDEARSFATMLRQAEEMGASLGETLAVFSDDLRNKRMLKAEEKALALSAKLMLPLILFLFPCLLGVLMMPAVVALSKVMKK
jgi:tight adherence protein C